MFSVYNNFIKNYSITIYFMKTYIKNSVLTKLIDPINDGIFYKDTLLKINLKDLSLYINNPTQYKLFQSSDEPLVSFYKDLALYIINFEKEEKMISIDLDQKNPITSGLFEYVKCLYFKKEYIATQLILTGNNLLLIKSKKLEEQHLSLPLAIDKHFSQLKPILDDSKNNELIQNSDSSYFFWTDGDRDIYSNKDFIFDKIQKIISETENKPHNQFHETITSLFERINPTLLNNDFFLYLMELNHSGLNKFIFSSSQSQFNIDFSHPLFQNKMFKDIKNNNFELLEMVFVHSSKNKYSIDSKNKYSIDWKYYLNQPETIEHLKTRYVSPSDSYSRDKENTFCISNCYLLLEERYQLNEKIIEQYIKDISYYNMNRDNKINKEKILKIPLHLFNNEYMLSQFLNHLPVESFSLRLKEENFTNNLITNKEFLLKNLFKMKNNLVEQTKSILINFYKAKDIDIPFVESLIKHHLGFIEIFSSHSKNYYDYDKRKTIFSHLTNNFDLFFFAYQLGYNIQNIPSEVISPYLFAEFDSPIKNQFILKWVIERNAFSPEFFSIIEDSDIIKYKEKFLRLEYLFFKDKFDSSHHKLRGKLLSKIKKEEEIHTLLSKIDTISVDSNFETSCFYQALHPSLKKNISIVKSLLKRGHLNFIELEDTLKFNKEIAIMFINRSTKYIRYIPQEFFNDAHFCLEFAKVLDTQGIDDCPIFVKKFFSNQGVDNKFYDYLKTYLQATNLQKQLEPSHSPEKIKHIKTKI